MGAPAKIEVAPDAKEEAASRLFVARGVRLQLSLVLAIVLLDGATFFCKWSGFCNYPVERSQNDAPSIGSQDRM